MMLISTNSIAIITAISIVTGISIIMHMMVWGRCVGRWMGSPHLMTDADHDHRYAGGGGGGLPWRIPFDGRLRVYAWPHAKPCARVHNPHLP